MTTYIAIESATGDVYEVQAIDFNHAYRTIAKVVLKMPGWNDEDFDIGNVDFDLYEIKGVVKDNVRKLKQDGEK